MHSLFATHGPALLPFFDQLLPTFSAMLVSERSLKDAQMLMHCYVPPGRRAAGMQQAVGVVHIRRSAGVC